MTLLDMTSRKSHTLRTRSALLASFWFGLFVLSALVGCSDSDSSHSVRLTGATMGTSYSITLVADEPFSDTDSLQREIDEVLQQLNRQMSTYIVDSEINTLKASPVNQWVPVSKPVAEVLGISLRVSDWSQGAFDVTLRPLIDLWGFGPKQTDDQIPEQSEIDRIRQQLGYQFIQLDDQNLKVLRSAAVDMDFSAVAKGYGVDVIASLLEQNDFSNYLVEIGGEIRVKGHNPKRQSWRVAVERPQVGLAQRIYKAIPLTDNAIATSGDYRNFFEQNGQRYSHTIDPRTGRPIVHNLASVTVIHSSAAMADALATAFNVMGAEQARLLANSKDIAAFFIIKQGDGFMELSSEAFKPYLASAQSLQ